MFFAPLLVSLFALFFTFFLIRKIQKIPLGSGKRIAVFSDILKEWQFSFKKQLFDAGPLAAFLFFLLLLTFGFEAALGFMAGFLLTELAGFAAAFFSIQSSIRAIEVKLPAFSGGLASGLLAMSLGLFGASGLYALTQSWQSLAALSLGAVFAAFFLRSENINPATDILSSYLAALAGSTALIALNFPGQTELPLLPLFLSSAAVLILIFISFFPKMGEKVFIGAILLSALSFSVIVKNFVAPAGLAFFPHYSSAVLGLLLLGALFILFCRGLLRKYQLVLLTGFGILTSFWLAGKMGFAIFLVSLLSSAGIALSRSAFGLITETAKKITEAAGESFPPGFISRNFREVLNGYASLSASLAALGLFLVYSREVQSASFSLDSPRVFVGLFFGGLLPHFLPSGAKRTKLLFLVLAALPVFAGFVFGPEALGGILIGSIISGLFVAISAGPAINPMIKVFNIVALLIVGFLV